jgi:hypothetical protein
MERLLDISVYEEDVDSSLRNLQHPNLPIDAAGEFCEETTALRRVLAISRLLLQADVDGYHHELLRSAHSRCYYLARCQREGYADFHVAASRAEPFFDALAAGDLALARRIADLSPRAPRIDEEYLEDFHYVHLLHLHVRSEGRDAEGLERQLAAFEVSLERSGARLELSKALLARDGRAFEAAFQSLLEERAVEVDRQKARFMIDAGDITASYVFIEGLAWLKLAEHAGLPTAEEYRFCPAMARLPMQRAFPGDGYPRG